MVHNESPRVNEPDKCSCLMQPLLMIEKQCVQLQTGKTPKNYTARTATQILLPVGWEENILLATYEGLQGMQIE